MRVVGKARIVFHHFVQVEIALHLKNMLGAEPFRAAHFDVVKRMDLNSLTQKDRHALLSSLDRVLREVSSKNEMIPTAAQLLAKQSRDTDLSTILKKQGMSDSTTNPRAAPGSPSASGADGIHQVLEAEAGRRRAGAASLGLASTAAASRAGLTSGLGAGLRPSAFSQRDQMLAAMPPALRASQSLDLAASMPPTLRPSQSLDLAASMPPTLRPSQSLDLAGAGVPPSLRPAS